MKVTCTVPLRKYSVYRMLHKSVNKGITVQIHLRPHVKSDCHRTDIYDVMKRIPTPNHINVRKAVLLTVTYRRTERRKGRRAGLVYN
jgi:hypothetical protein